MRQALLDVKQLNNYQQWHLLSIPQVFLFFNLLCRGVYIALPFLEDIFIVYLDTVQNIFENISTVADSFFSVFWLIYRDLRIFSIIYVRKPVIVCTLYALLRVTVALVVICLIHSLHGKNRFFLQHFLNHWSSNLNSFALPIQNELAYTSTIVGSLFLNWRIWCTSPDKIKTAHCSLVLYPLRFLFTFSWNFSY